MSQADVIREMAQSVAANKCHKCGCFQDAVSALQESELGAELSSELATARATFQERKYDCLGCDTCWPSNALNLAEELVEIRLPSGAGCATEIPEAREGWPPYPGDYRVGTYKGPVAVCTLHSHQLVAELAGLHPAGLAIVGSLRTENLGIERIVQNVVANPNIRFLVLCGEDTEGRVGHFPGQSLLALCREGVSDKGRITGAKGKRPVLKNLNEGWVDAFREQVELVDHRGLRDLNELASLVSTLADQSPGPMDSRHELRVQPQTIEAAPPKALILDPAGYVVIYLDRERGRLVAEHYENRGTITTAITGERAGDVIATLLDEGLVTRLDHAAYLGRQLALAEQALLNGTSFEQDGAPEPEPGASSCGRGCGTSCS